MEDAKIKPGKKDSTLVAAFSYLGGIFGTIGLLVPLLIYLTQKEDRYVRFHSLQALMFEITLFIAAMIVAIPFFIIYIPIFFVTLGIANIVLIAVILLIALCLFLLRLAFAYKAFKGKAFMLPRLGEMALERV